MYKAWRQKFFIFFYISLISELALPATCEYLCYMSTTIIHLCSISVRTDFRLQILVSEDAARSWQIKDGICVSILAPPVIDLREVVMAD